MFKAHQGTDGSDANRELKSRSRARSRLLLPPSLHRALQPWLCRTRLND